MNSYWTRRIILEVRAPNFCSVPTVLHADHPPLHPFFHAFTVYTTMDRAKEVVVLPPTLKKYVRFVVLRDPISLVKHSYPISGVQSTEGALNILNTLEQNVQRKHRKSVFAWLCDSVIREYRCCLGVHCPNVHVTDQGYKTRRLWAKTYPERAKKGKLGTLDDVGGEEGDEGTRWRKGASRYTHKPYATSNSVAATCHANWLAAVGLQISEDSAKPV